VKCNYIKDNHVRVANFETSNNLVVKNKMFPYRNIHKYIRAYLERKTHNQIYRILTNRIWHTNIIVVRSVRKADCDTGH